MRPCPLGMIDTGKMTAILRCVASINFVNCYFLLRNRWVNKTSRRNNPPIRRPTAINGNFQLCFEHKNLLLITKRFLFFFKLCLIRNMKCSFHAYKVAAQCCGSLKICFFFIFMKLKEIFFLILHVFCKAVTVTKQTD